MITQKDIDDLLKWIKQKNYDENTLNKIMKDNHGPMLYYKLHEYDGTLHRLEMMEDVKNDLPDYKEEFKKMEEDIFDNN
jgi:hypothetical protein